MSIVMYQDWWIADTKVYMYQCVADLIKVGTVFNKMKKIVDMFCFLD